MENKLWEKYGWLLDNQPELFGLDEITINLKELREHVAMDYGPAYELFNSMRAIWEDETEQWMGFKGIPRVFMSQLILMSNEYRNKEFIIRPENNLNSSWSEKEEVLLTGPAQHPRRDNKNNIVTLTNPSTPTKILSWYDATKIATCLPEGSVPETLNDLNLIPWAGAPKTVHGWNFVQGINQTLEEEQLQSINGKKLSAGAVVVEADGRVWVVHPSNHFGGYITTFPKGRVDNQLSLQATAIKEVFEESGLHVEIMGLLGDFEHTTTVTRYYLARRLAGTPADMGWESQAVSLVPPEKLDSMLNGPADKPVLAALKAALILK